MIKKFNFGATQAQIEDFLVPLRDLKINEASLKQDVETTLELLQKAKQEYLNLLNTRSVTVEQILNEGAIPDYALYTPQTKLEVDMMADIVIRRYCENIKEKFYDFLYTLVSPNDIVVYSNINCFNVYIYTDINPVNYEVERNHVITTAVQKLKRYSGEYTVKNFVKEIKQGTPTLQSEIQILLKGWVVVRVYIYPKESIKQRAFLSELTENSFFNRYGFLYSLLEKQRELPYFYQETNLELFLEVDTLVFLKKIQDSVVHWRELAIEVLHKKYPLFLESRNTHLISNLAIYIMYFANFIGTLILTGGNSIHVKTNTPLINDLDFVTTSIDENAIYKFIYILQNIKIEQQKAWSSKDISINYKIGKISLRITDNRKSDYKQYSIDIHVEETFKIKKETYTLPTIYTLAEFKVTTKDTSTSVPLTVHFKDQPSTSLFIQDVYTDLYKLSTIDIGPRTEDKRVRDVERLRLLIHQLKKLNTVFDDRSGNVTSFKGEKASMLYSTFVKCMESITVPPIKQIVIFSTQTVTINSINFPESEAIQKLKFKLKKGNKLKEPGKNNEEEEHLLEQMNQEVIEKQNEIIKKLQAPIVPAVLLGFHKSNEDVFYIPEGKKPLKLINKKYKIYYDFVKNVFKPKFDKLLKVYLLEIIDFIEKISKVPYDLTKYFNTIYGFPPNTFTLDIFPALVNRIGLHRYIISIIGYVDILCEKDPSYLIKLNLNFQFKILDASPEIHTLLLHLIKLYIWNLYVNFTSNFTEKEKIYCKAANDYGIEGIYQLLFDYLKTNLNNSDMMFLNNVTLG